MRIWEQRIAELGMVVHRPDDADDPSWGLVLTNGWPDIGRASPGVTWDDAYDQVIATRDAMEVMAS